MADLDWRRLPPLTTLRAFEATARLGGYAAAARELNVTPAAIAQHVRKLEADVGIALVRRKGRGLILTEEGYQLSLPLREAFAVIAKGIEDMRLRSAVRGVRVSTTDYFVDAIVMPRLGDLWKAHPTLQVSFSPEGSQAPVDMDRFDVVVRGGPPGRTWDGLRSVPLLSTPVIVCGAPSLVGKGDVNLASLPWIKDSSFGSDLFRRILGRAGCDPDAVTIVDPGAARFEIDFALRGFGLSVGPELVHRRHLAEGTLVRLDVSLGVAAVYYAIVRSGELPVSVRLLFDWLQDVCADQSGPLDA